MLVLGFGMANCHKTAPEPFKLIFLMLSLQKGLLSIALPEELKYNVQSCEPHCMYL